MSKSEIKSKAPSGEPLIWLNALGLAVGLLMIFGILLLIFYQGVAAFWPKDIAELRLKSVSGGAEKRISGEVTKKQIKKSAIEGNATGNSSLEWQLFVGNKDAYGFSFLFVDYEDIAGLSYPEELMTLERVEYGRAIGYPVALEEDGGKLIAAESPDFDKEFKRRLSEVNDRRHEIKRVEKVEIGRINSMIEKIRLQLRSLERQKQEGNSVETEITQSLHAEQQELLSEYEVLEQRAQELRKKQDEVHLHYRLSTGEERSISVGEIINRTYTNQLNLIQKVGVLIHRVYKFIVDDPREANTEGGIYPAIYGTFVMTLIMSLIVTPFGVVAAIYLSEYARSGPMVKLVRIAVNNLAGVPSIVFGVFGLGFFVYFVGGSIDQLLFGDKLPTPTFGTGGILWASLTLALLTVPVVIVATEEGLAAVPRGMREGGLACGASKWQCIQRIVLPAAAPGILTGIILAVARGAGEVAPLMLVGVVKSAPTLPINMTYPFVHLEQKFMHLGFHIYDLGFQSPDSEAAKPVVFATTFLLIVLVIVLNLAAIFLREKLRERLKSGH